MLIINLILVQGTTQKGMVITMNNVKDVQNNSLKVSEDVIYHIAQVAACDVKGVSGLCEEKLPFANIFLKSDKSSAIKIKMQGDVVEISVSIIVNCGFKIASVAELVQQKIKEDIQTMTGIAVSKINVIVNGISLLADK